MRGGRGTRCNLQPFQFGLRPPNSFHTISPPIPSPPGMGEMLATNLKPFNRTCLGSADGTSTLTPCNHLSPTIFSLFPPPTLDDSAGGCSRFCLLGPCRAGLPAPRGNEAGGSKVLRSSFYRLLLIMERDKNTVK